MHALLFLAFAAVAQVEARRYNNALRYERRVLANETVGSYYNTTTVSTTSTSSSTSSSSSSTTTSNTNSTTTLTPLPGTESTGPAPPSNGTSDGADCVGLVTYYGSVPPTVYSTVTEGFEVTVTASNASVTEGDTLITPPPACQSTIMPLLGSFQPLATIAISSKLPPGTSSYLSHTEFAEWSETSGAYGSKTTSGSPWAPEMATWSRAPGGSPKNPQATPPGQESVATPMESFTVIASTIYATAPYTSTVIVTKKTPVVVVSPATSSPPVFQQPGGPNQNNNPPGGSPSSPAGGSPPPSNAPANGNPPSPPSNAPKNDNPPPPAPSVGPGAAPGSRPSNPTAGLGDIIVSLIKTQNFVPAATAGPQTTIANVPVAFLPSTVLIGSSAIPIPKSSEVVATVDGQLFTVRPTEIAAPGTVIGFGPMNNVQMQPAPIPSTQVTIAPGVIAQVAGSTAVIAGTTYRIGFGATSTTITVNGVPVGIGPYGLALPSTTVAANAVTDAPMVVESAGGLTFSINQSEVVIEGTTYRIGSGAPTITTEIDGQTLSIGPGGVGLKTTTLKPTAATAMSGSRASGGAAATSSGMVQGSSATRVVKRIGMKEMLGWMLMVVGGGWLLL